MMKAWHLVNEDGTTNYLKETEIVGNTYYFNGVPVVCGQGLHASRRIIDALCNAKGLRLKYCEMGGNITHRVDKMCATERTVIAELLPEQFQPILFTWLRDDILIPLFANERESGREVHADTLAVVDMLTKGIDGTLTKDAAYAAAKAAANAAANAGHEGISLDSLNSALEQRVLQAMGVTADPQRTRR